MKKLPFILIPLLLILGLLFWAPWMAEDGGEDTIRVIIQMPKVQTELETLTAQYGCTETNMNTDCCDGMSSSWAPFGRNVNYCDHGSWYAPFWGN